MNSFELVQAIKSLVPSAQFSFDDADYSTIKWDFLEGEAPTWAEIEKAHRDMKEAEKQAQARKEAKRLAALAKLEALGLDEDDLKALSF